MILVAGSAADTDRARHLSFFLQGNSPREYHDAPMIRGVNPEELAPGLRMLRQILRRNVKSTRSESLVHRNIDAADPRTIHPNVSHQISARIHDGNVHRLPNLGRFLLGCGNHFTRGFQINHVSDFLLSHEITKGLMSQGVARASIQIRWRSLRYFEEVSGQSPQLNSPGIKCPPFTGFTGRPMGVWYSRVGSMPSIV